MKRAYLFFVVLFTSTIATAQTLNTLFLQLPDSCLLHPEESRHKPLNSAGRASLLKKQTFDGYDLIAFDTQNGYLRFITVTNDPEYIEYVVEMTYWKLKSGAKLVGLNIIAGSRSHCYTKRIFWLKYENGKWIDCTSQYLPKLQIEDFYAPNKAPTTPKLRNMRWYFSLPRSGVNIAIHPPAINDVSVNIRPIAYYEMQWVNERFELMRKLYEK